MKKVPFFILLLLLTSLGTVNINGQVTIGANQEPHPGALLDLQSSIKGLRLPVVGIYDANVFQLSADGSQAEGMIVYNSYSDMVDGLGAGVYVWDGSKWRFVAVNGGTSNPVNQIVVTSDAENVITGGTVPFHATVYPTSATNRNYSWSVQPNPGSGVVDTTGLFTASIPGKVKVRATAQDGSGVYGEKEILISSAKIMVTSISITATGGAKTLVVGQTLQLSANVQPSNATNKTVTWSIVLGTAATINPTTGLVTGTGSGTVIVQASASDGSGITAIYPIEVSMPTGAGFEQGYNIYCYPKNIGCWMTDNSKLGNPSKTTYKDKGEGERGYYYSWYYASNACPSGYHLPTESEWKSLKTYLDSDKATYAEKDGWFTLSELAGSHNGMRWSDWNFAGYWWSSTSNQYFQYSHTPSVYLVGPRTIATTFYISVRCVKPN
ncbi:MAG: Ig-like domain-containing protein [Candidatus Symbiothrix sp.]|jgi:uncharacterized protein (TIGR02145 family)|nr:Ig-like domain-containing protein [Candidatus Symbiothrix sp.]